MRMLPYPGADSPARAKIRGWTPCPARSTAGWKGHRRRAAHKNKIRTFGHDVKRPAAAELPPGTPAGMIAPLCRRETMQASRTFCLRPATPADGERVAAMCAALSAEEGLGATSQFTAAAFRRDGFGPMPAFACLIAEIDGAPVGYALHCQDYDTDRLCRSVYLADLYVEKAARGRGVGRALMAATAAAGRAQGARLMMWSVLRSNEPARRFYAMLGKEIDGQIEMVVARERFDRL